MYLRAPLQQFEEMQMKSTKDNLPRCHRRQICKRCCITLLCFFIYARACLPWSKSLVDGEPSPGGLKRTHKPNCNSKHWFAKSFCALFIVLSSKHVYAFNTRIILPIDYMRYNRNWLICLWFLLLNRRGHTSQTRGCARLSLRKITKLGDVFLKDSCRPMRIHTPGVLSPPVLFKPPA